MLWSHQAPLSLLEAVSSCPTGSISYLNLKLKCVSQPHLPPPLPEADCFYASCVTHWGVLDIVDKLDEDFDLFPKSSPQQNQSKSMVIAKAKYKGKKVCPS